MTKFIHIILAVSPLPLLLILGLIFVTAFVISSVFFVKWLKNIEKKGKLNDKVGRKRLILTIVAVLIPIGLSILLSFILYVRNGEIFNLYIILLNFATGYFVANGLNKWYKIKVSGKGNLLNRKL